MRFQLAPLRPGVSLVVMIDIAEEKTGLALVDNQSNVAPGPHRPETLVLGFGELVKAHAWTSRIHLKIESRSLDLLLLLGGEPGKAIGEGIGDTKIHQGSIRSRPSAGLAAT